MASVGSQTSAMSECGNRDTVNCQAGNQYKNNDVDTSFLPEFGVMKVFALCGFGCFLIHRRYAFRI